MSNYSLLATGSAQGTGAYAEAIAAQPGGINNNGNATDSAGNVRIDRAWGNFPMQPNDERVEVAAVQIGGYSQDTGWGETSQVTGARLALGSISKTLNNGITQTVNTAHEIAAAEWASYPSYTPAIGSYIVTQAKGDGTTIRYESFNFLAVGDTVNITNCGNLNLSGATVATATRDFFTVTNATVGAVSNITAKVEPTNALTYTDGAYVAGVAYLVVPAVVGLTTALAVDALKDAGYTTANITTASAATNTAVTITAAARTAGSAITTLTAATHGFSVNQKVTITSGDTPSIVGTFTILTVPTAGTFTVSTAATTVLSATPTASVVGVTGTVKTQSVAANAASIALGTAVSVTPFA